MVNGIGMTNLPEHPLERMRVMGTLLAQQQAAKEAVAAPAAEPPAAPVRSARAAYTELFGSQRRPAPDAIVSLVSGSAPAPGKTEGSAGPSAASIEPKYETPDETRFNRLMYATRDTARALAERFGGAVGMYQFKWATSASATPGIAAILQPPEFHILDFGNTQVNAGELARFYEPGFDANPDARAAEYLFRAGVRNDFVSRHLPGYLRGVDTSNTTNPLTGERVQVA